MIRRAAETFAEWRKKVKDEELRSELEAMASDEKTAENRFYKDLQFGTGGLRGELGAGTNAMNIYTVGRASAGLAQYVLSQGGGAVAVCYDTRRKSALFARRTACVLAGRGVRVYLAKECMPTPFLSFAVRHSGAAAGVMITASHNPAQYNGYKVYGSDGCQITDGAAAEISSFISREDYFGKQDDDFDTLSAAGKISYIEEEVETAYLAAVRRLGLCSAEGLRVAYTPLNGTGYRLVPKVLEEIGASICPVPEQSMPDGEFPTCPYPNPEKEEALALGLKYAREDKADILLATDPDADRVGVAVNAQGTFVRLSGNEVGVLLMDYLLGERAAQGKLPENGVVVKTIVTTSLAEKLAAQTGGDLYEIRSASPYPETYRETVAAAVAELSAGLRPTLAQKMPDIGQYDAIFLAYPNWCGTTPMAVRSFLESADFSGKRIFPVCTHEGSGAGRSAADILSSAPAAVVEKPLEILGSNAETCDDKIREYLTVRFKRGN